MNLISNIIQELIDSDTSLDAPLFKTKVLASRIKNNELLYWVNNEINGYPKGTVIPEYRMTKTTIRANYMNGYYQYQNQALSTCDLPEPLAEKLNTKELDESVSVLESLYRSTRDEKNGGVLSIVIPPEAVSFMEHKIREKGNPYFHIIKAWRELGADYILQTLSVIKSKLLDFMLALEEEFGMETPIENLQANKNKVTQIMNSTIINAGEGNVINTGENSNLTVNITINKGDKTQLEKALLDNAISKEDAQELIAVVDDEQPVAANNYGDKVKKWMQKMLGKAVDGSWQVGIGAAGTILAEILKQYYGQ